MAMLRTAMMTMMGCVDDNDDDVGGRSSSGRAVSVGVVVVAELCRWA